MDGVITSFSEGCKDIFNWPVWDHTPLKDVRGHLKISTKEFWNTIDYYGEEWWANLPEEEWARELVNIVSKYDKDFTILSSPSLSHFAASGKVLWLQKFFKSKRFERYIITPAINKCKVANFNSVLIDDNDENCKQFQEKGGSVILFPRIWNKNHTLENQKLEYLKTSLDKLSIELWK
jgi:hypothetical protein